MTKTQLVVIVIVVLFFAAWTVFRNFLRRKRAQEPGTFDDPERRARIREDLEHLMVQMQEVAREQIAKADIKIRMLNQLLAECDEKKRDLETLLGRTPKPPEPPRKSTNPLHEKIYSLQDQGRPVLEICTETGLEIGEVEMILGLRKIQ